MSARRERCLFCHKWDKIGTKSLWNESQDICKDKKSNLIPAAGLRLKLSRVCYIFFCVWKSKTPRFWINYGLNYKVSFFVVFCLPRSFRPSKSLTNSLKKILPLIFPLSDNNYVFYFAKTLLHVVRLLWATIASFGYASGHRAVGKVINFDFARFRWNFNMM